MTEITFIEAVASKQVVTEVERNLEEKMPAAMPAFQMIVSRGRNKPNTTKFVHPMAIFQGIMFV